MRRGQLPVALPVRSPIETKVALPAVVVACLSVLAGAAYQLARAYGFSPTAEQDLALVGLGSAVLYVVHVVIGYFAPHTPRPDVVHPETTGGEAVGEPAAPSVPPPVPDVRAPL